MPLCLDASAVVAAFLPRSPSPAAAALIWDAVRAGDRLVAPPLVHAETTAVLRRYVHLDRIEHEEALTALRDLFALPLTVIHNPDLYLRALELARRLGQAKAYDVQYLAVAQLHNSTLVTLDRDLYQHALTLGVDAQLLV